MGIGITGAAGFVGRNLLGLLAGTEHEVIACDIAPLEPPASNISYRKLDITDETAVRSMVEDVDVVGHLAAHQLPESREAPRLNAEVNVMGSLNILEAARDTDLEKVFFSSASSVVGEVKEVPVSEDHPVTPQSPYGVAKHAIEEYLRVYNQLYDLDYLVYRFYNVYGPHQYPESGALVPVVIDRLDRGEGVYVTGDGRQTRDFIYVKDVADYIVQGLESDVKNELVNMGTGTGTEIIKAINVMADIVGVDPEIEKRPERPDEIDDFYADVSKCERLFGSTPATSFEEGVAETYRWLQTVDSQ